MTWWEFLVTLLLFGVLFSCIKVINTEIDKDDVRLEALERRVFMHGEYKNESNSVT